MGRTRRSGAVAFGAHAGDDEREAPPERSSLIRDGWPLRATPRIYIIARPANRVDVLDSALLRPGRFDRQVMVDPPTSRVVWKC